MSQRPVAEPAPAPSPGRPRPPRRLHPAVVLVVVLVVAGAVAGILVAVLGRSTPTVTAPPSTVPPSSVPSGSAPTPVPVSVPPLVSATPPPGAVTISTGAQPQSVVDASPAGTSFVISAGVHSGFSVVPRTGDRFYGAPGAVLDGQHATAAAFVGVKNGQPADDVTIVGASAADPLVIRNYSDGGQAQSGTIQTTAGRRATGVIWATKWRLQYLDVTQSFSRGITLSDGMVIEGCQVVDNGRLGIGGAGTGIVVADNLVSSNGIGVSRRGFEAGGLKTGTDGILITGNRFIDNGAPGVWTDVNATGVRILDNTITGNQLGVHIEISHYVTVAGNRVVSNHKIGILVIASDHVTVTGNLVKGNVGGIVAGGTGRSTKRGPSLLTDVSVTHNVVIDSGRSGVSQPLPSTWIVNFNDNTYTNASFEWYGQHVSFSEWRADGQDRQGTLSP